MCERRDTWGAFQGFFLLFALFEWQKLDLMCRKLDMMTTVQRNFSYSSARHDCLIAFKYTSRTHNRSEVTNLARHIWPRNFRCGKVFFRMVLKWVLWSCELIVWFVNGCLLYVSFLGVISVEKWDFWAQ